MEKKNFVNVSITNLVAAQNALYEAQKDVVAQLLGTEEYSYRDIDNLLHQLQSNLQNYEYGQREDLGWAWGETYERQIDRLETLIAAVTPVHTLIARACCGRFEDEQTEHTCMWETTCKICDEEQTSKAISIHTQEVDHAFWAENRGRTLSDVVDANCKGSLSNTIDANCNDWDDNDLPF
jgi:hypothetical protein